VAAVATPVTVMAPSTGPCSRQRTRENPATLTYQMPGRSVETTAVPPARGVQGNWPQFVPSMVVSKYTVPSVPDGAALAEAEGLVLGETLALLEALGEALPDGEALLLTLALALPEGDTDAEGDRLMDVDPEGEALPEGDGLPDGLPEMLGDGLVLLLTDAEADALGLTDAELSTA
jgi:hypothetical protein